MEKLTVIFFIIMAVFGIELQYIVGKLATPVGYVYLGTVHWPSDYFYYLSQFAQGSSHWLYSTMLFTPETLKPVLVGWQNVLTGKLLMLFGLDVITAYQFAVALYLSLFLAVSYLFIREIFPKDLNKRLLSLMFFLTATSLFRLKWGSRGFEWTYFDHWYNLGIPLARFGPRPHHLLSYALAVSGWLFYLRKKHLFLAVSGFLLSSINPVAWGLNVLAVLITSLVTGPAIKKRLNLRTFLPVGLLFVSGILPALYTRAVFAQPPYHLSSDWEAFQHLKLKPEFILIGTGLVSILAFFGVKNFLRKRDRGRIFGLVYLSAAVFFYLSDISQKFNISNARFWPSQVYLIWGLLAAEGIIRIAKFFGKYKKIILTILMIIYFMSIAPALYLSYKKILAPQLENGYYYMPKDIYNSFLDAEKISRPGDVFLVIWPYNEAFPGLTNRKTVFGYELFTINYREKMTKAFAVIDGKLGEAELKKTLSFYRIKYLLMYSGSNSYFKQFPFLKVVYANPMINIYQVDLD